MHARRLGRFARRLEWRRGFRRLRLSLGRDVRRRKRRIRGGNGLRGRFRSRLSSGLPLRPHRRHRRGHGLAHQLHEDRPAGRASGDQKYNLPRFHPAYPLHPQ